MKPEEILKQHIAKTAFLTEEQFNYLFLHFQPEHFKKGQVIVSEGDQVDKEYFVLEGCLKAFFINDEMKMHILQFAMPTWWTYDYGALYNQTRATIHIDCITDAAVLSLTNSNREKICRELHQVEHYFR